jgi:hypothetical protein
VWEGGTYLTWVVQISFKTSNTGNCRFKNTRFRNDPRNVLTVVCIIRHGTFWKIDLK